MNLKKYSKALMVACAALLASCYPQGAEFYEDTDVVFTNFVSGYDFKSKGTFAMPDSIVKITGDALGIGNDGPSFIPKVVATPLLARIRQNMVSMGYTEVDGDANPDLVLLPAAIESTTIVYWYDYWGWWYGGYYPGYPYYPYYPSYTSYTTGTLVMNLVDPAVTAGDGNSISQWTGAIAGMLSYSYDANRANRLIDQAFTQSPYLKTN
jgi:hypothetical protein